MSDVTVRILSPEELKEDFLDGFSHRTRITEIWVREGGRLVLRPTDMIREWSEEKKRWITLWLRDQTEEGGAAIGAYEDGRLVGFASVDGPLTEGFPRYANLTLLFVDDARQRRGIGSLLFGAACACAKRKGADRLFVSAVPSRETIAFYTRMGCRDAETVPPDFVDTEEDLYLEFPLTGREIPGESGFSSDFFGNIS